jgi:hypothetical protein
LNPVALCTRWIQSILRVMNHKVDTFE